MKASRNGLPISRLMFADDLPLCAKVDMDQIEIILDCLDRFCSVSGQKVTIEKTQIIFSKNVTTEMREAFASSSGFSIANNLGRYLGAYGPG